MGRPGKNLTVGTLIFLVSFIGASVFLYAGAQVIEPGEQAAAEDDGEEGDDGVTGGPVTIRLVAKDLKFDKRSISAGTGAQVTVVVDNQDGGVLHNVAFYTNNRATQQIYAGELFQGPAVREATFTAPTTAGAYYFRCDAHPDTMNGTFNVR